jgi:DNA-binding MarR family transcriptional regulator
VRKKQSDLFNLNIYNVLCALRNHVMTNSQIADLYKENPSNYLKNIRDTMNLGLTKYIQVDKNKKTKYISLTDLGIDVLLKMDDILKVMHKVEESRIENVRTDRVDQTL